MFLTPSKDRQKSFVYAIFGFSKTANWSNIPTQS